MKHKLATALISISAGGLIAFYTWEHWPRPQVTASLGAPPAGSLMAAYPDAGKPAEPTKPDVAPAAPVAPSMQPASLSAEYAAKANGTPTQKMEAYKMVERCLDSRKYPALARVTKAWCGDLQPGQLASRIDVLLAAAEHGRGSAWSKLASEIEGQYGSGYFPDTPANRAVLERARLAGIANGDSLALQTVLPKLRTSDRKEDLVQALAYQVATLIDAARQTSLPVPTVEKLANNEGVQLIAKRAKLTPEEQAEAMQRGIELAKRQDS
jgi:hypothetical protein